MRKSFLFTIAMIACCVVIIFLFRRCAYSRALDDLPLNEQVLMIFKEKGCVDCHSGTPNLPFYASFPLVGKTVHEDIETGYRAFNIDPVVATLEANGVPSEVALAKVEYTVTYGSMPPGKYKAAHWNSSLTREDKEILSAWIMENRQKYYSTGLAAPEFMNEPIQPMVDSLPVDPAKVFLGFELYHDMRLSKNNLVSCATCHPLDKAGVDHLQFSKGIYDQIGGINAPTVYNAAFNHAQFWDGRKADLAAQAGGPPFDGLEMGSESWEEIIEKLSKDPELVTQFDAIYPDGMTGDNIMNAIAEFEMTLITPNSRFDKYLKGDKNAITPEEAEGYALFKEFGCATCHVGQAMGGQSFEYFGILADYFGNREMPADREIIQIKDQGHYNATENEADLRYFKTPNLRNVALTPPYLHDGTIDNLTEATNVMLKYQVKKNASPEQVDKIVKFLHTLNGEYQGAPMAISED